MITVFVCARIRELAKNYKHGLLLFTGAMDKTVKNPAHTLRLADALIKGRQGFRFVCITEMHARILR